MTDNKPKQDRLDLLADVAEMYFLEGKNQTEIAGRVGVTRSMISRMLTEARSMGMVKIQIERSLQINHDISTQLQNRFNLDRVIVTEASNGQSLLAVLGMMASRLLLEELKPYQTLGVSWGTAVSSVVDYLTITDPIPGIKIVQLLGAIGSRVHEYDGFSIVHNLAEKLGAEGIFLNSPFLVEDQTIASSLKLSKGIKEALDFGMDVDIALLGIGSTQLDVSPYYLAGYVSKDEILGLQRDGAIGDVCGIFFDYQGKLSSPTFQSRTIGVSPESFLSIPRRIGIAGGPEKVLPILGALKGMYINVLVTDANTAKAVLLENE